MVLSLDIELQGHKVREMHRIWLQVYLQFLGAIKLNQVGRIQKCQAPTGFHKERCVGSLPALNTCGSALAAYQAPPTISGLLRQVLLRAGAVHSSLQSVVLSSLVWKRTNLDGHQRAVYSRDPMD